MTQNQFIAENVYGPLFAREQNLIGIEIGVMTACGSVALLNTFPNLKLYCIDPWKHFENSEYEAANEQAYHDLNYEHALSRLKEYGDRAVIVKKTSDEAVQDVSLLYGKVDFVHIDGHHSYDQVRKDVLNYRDLIKIGGIISGHDYGQVPDVKRAVDEIFGEELVNKGDDFTWWFYL